MSAQRIIPILVYEDIQAAHDHLVGVFGFRAGGVTRDAGGETVHGEVFNGDEAIWLHRVSPDHDLGSPRGQAVTHGGLVVTVDDVDAHHVRSRDAGASLDSDPTDQPYGRREYGVRDPEGHRWWFGTPLAE